MLHRKSWVSEEEISHSTVGKSTCLLARWSLRCLDQLLLLHGFSKVGSIRQTCSSKTAISTLEEQWRPIIPWWGNYFLLVKRMESLGRPNVLVWKSKYLTKGQPVSQEGIHLEQCKIDRRIICLYIRWHAFISLSSKPCPQCSQWRNSNGTARPSEFWLKRCKFTSFIFLFLSCRCWPIPNYAFSGTLGFLILSLKLSFLLCVPWRWHQCQLSSYNMVFSISLLHLPPPYSCVAIGAVLPPS